MTHNKLPKEWKLIKLGEICNKMSNGANAKQFEDQIGLPISRIETIWNETIDLKRVKYIYENDEAFIEKYALKKNDILFSHINSDIHLGKTALFKNQTKTLIHGINLLLIRLCKEAQPDFFNYQFNYKRRKGEFITIASKSVNQSSINQPKLKNIDFVLPPIEIQTLIVSKIEELFSELDKGIEDLKTAQQQLKTYRQSVLKWAFEGKLTNKKVRDGELPKVWEIMNIGKICKCIVPNRDKPKSFNGDIKWVTTPNLKSNSIKLEYENISQGLSQSEVEEYNARVIPIGGVIMTCVGNFGLAAIVEKPIVINQQLHAFISNDLIAPKFIAYNIQYNKYFFEKKSTSTTIQYINKENCNSMPIPLCSVEEQHRIVQEIESRLSVADKMEESIGQSLLQAEALRQSILKKAFSGELV